MNFALPFGTVGGDMYRRVAEFTDAHYEQTNTALNKEIWGDLPLTVAELDKLEKDVDDNLDILRTREENVPFEHELLQPRISAFEETRNKVRLGVLLRLIRGADAEHLPAGDPAQVFLQKGHADKFESLSSAIKRTKRLVEVIDKVYAAKSNCAAAAARYALAILELYPWVNSPILFTSDKAFESFAPLSLELWDKLGKACVAHTHTQLGHDDGAAASWTQDALRVAQLGICERFTTRGKLYAAFEVMSIAQLLSVTPAERRAWSGDACSSAQAKAKLRNGQDLMKTTWASLFLLSEILTNCKRADTWAHADCLIGHSCGTYGNFINFMQWGPAQAHAHQIGQLAIQYEPRPCNFKDGIPYYCARGEPCVQTPKELVLATQ